MIAEELGLGPEVCRGIFLASPLHDIGKVAVPDSILLKSGHLDDHEMAVIRTHAEIGERLLGESTSDLMRLAAGIAGNHHERWDGKGYPRGLAGTAIPLCARIVALIRPASTPSCPLTPGPTDSLRFARPRGF